MPGTEDTARTDRDLIFIPTVWVRVCKNGVTRHAGAVSGAVIHAESGRGVGMDVADGHAAAPARGHMSSNQIERPCRKPSPVTGSSKKQSTRSRNAYSEKSRLLHQMTARSKKKAPSSRWAPLLMGLWRNYSSISMTTPEPTVRPPSRIAKRRPFSIAIGVISSTFMSMLSPGMHISTPSGREMMPVTSVVLK